MKKASQLFLIFTVVLSFGFTKITNSVPKQINVVIDLGHGGYDFGAKIFDINEKNIVEQFSKKIKSSNENVVIHFTRNEDKFLSLKDRTDFINKLKPALVLSIHVNANSDINKSGLEFYVAKDGKFLDKSTEIAKKLSVKLSENKVLKTTEIKNAPFYILKNSEAPAVIVELGYLTNENDFKYLTNDNEQIKIANSISEFISELK